MSVSNTEKIGVCIQPWGSDAPSAGTLLELAAHADELGFGSLSLGWHSTLPPGGKFENFNNRSLIDPFVLLPAIAATTQRIRLALNSAVLAAQHPWVLAQHFASLNALAAGRCIAGGAIGWYADDFKIGAALSKERGARADESLDTVGRLWRGEEISTPGRFWDASGMVIDPRPKPGEIPVWVGGGMPAIPRAARWGDALLPVNVTPDALGTEIGPRLAEEAETRGRRVGMVVMAYCAVLGDDSADDTVERYVESFARPECADSGRPRQSMVVGTASECADQIRRFFDAGAEHILLDCTFHGQRRADQVREQWDRLANDVVAHV